MKAHVCFVALSVYGYFNEETPPGGGAERQLALLSKELSENYRVSFVVGDIGQSQFEKQHNVEFFKAYRRDPSASFIDRIMHLYKLFRAMRLASPDVFVYRGKPGKAIIVNLLAGLLRRPFVYNVANDSNVGGDYDYLSWFFRFLFRSSLSRADTVIAQTDQQKQAIEGKFGIPSHVVPNGYPTSQRVTSYDQRDFILWVGRLNEQQKRPHIFLDIAEQRPDIEFRIACKEGTDAQYNEQILTRSNKIPNLTNLGTVSPDDIHEQYSRAIALVNTSAYEGFPNTFLEAWRQGTPVLSLDVNPYKFIKIQNTGYCHGSINQLIDLIDVFTSRQSMWEEYSKPSRAYFEENLTIDAVSAEYANIISTVLE